jgi:hypothetical protein
VSILPDSVRGVSKRVITPLIRGFAGKHFLALMCHGGRHSGHTYATP